ncbi:DAK2 domain-containing protein [Alicyclobacillus sp. SO9]|uniref:DAK2 domain-containing protein n=1 Tax=Alicyclobacillus sp. SO9 TaxID=2665646 RepID=UPI0018E71EE6|nr:DAK2 domain-containing protein [Alicyclobacillus sp. SO9]QQE80746.1 DAK2 domain-containing protein [Alicyclobacillus sp. SO9]
MALKYQLSTTEFMELMAAGHGRLKEKVSEVNALNIFPVPDGDTGTNMEMSMAAGVEYLHTSNATQLRKAVQAFSTGLMMGARGNSGVILSQLFRGFSKAGQDAETLNVAAFASALQEGVQIAYRAVAKPVEGTILSVARAAAQTALKEARQTEDIAALFEVVYESAQRALEKTPSQLEVLKQAGVVDSGGQGLVFIFEGFLRYLKGGQLSVASAAVTNSDANGVGTLQLDYAGAHISHDGEYGYCTEFLLRTEAVSASEAEQKLRRDLSRHGDSLLVVGSEELVRAHVHTLHPGKVLEEALAIGPLLKVKIDNMTEQHSEIRAQQDAVPAPSSSNASERKPLAVVAVAAGDGLREAFVSLGVDVVLEGGQTMNPSTEDIVTTVNSANCDECILLPNNKNILLAAEQAKSVVGAKLHLVKTETIPQGIAAMMAFHPNHSVNDNVLKMMSAIHDVLSGQVVRAVRDSTFQEREIRQGQYLGLVDQELMEVGESRVDTAVAVVKEMNKDGLAELLTLFYGADVSMDEIQQLRLRLEAEYDIEIEANYGGQPVYDYIFSLE